MKLTVKRSQHWFEASLRVPLIRECLARGSSLVLILGDRQWRRRRRRGGGRGRQGLVDQNLVRGGQTVQTFHCPVRTHHLLVRDEGLVSLAERHELGENIFLVLEVFLDCHQDWLGVGLLAHHVTLLLVLGHQGLDWTWQRRLVPSRGGWRRDGGRGGGGWSGCCHCC